MFKGTRWEGSSPLTEILTSTTVRNRYIINSIGYDNIDYKVLVDMLDKYQDNIEDSIRNLNKLKSIWEYIEMCRDFESLSYALKDINYDNIPELIVRRLNGNRFVFNIYYYEMACLKVMHFLGGYLDTELFPLIYLPKSGELLSDADSNNEYYNVWGIKENRMYTKGTREEIDSSYEIIKFYDILTKNYESEIHESDSSYKLSILASTAERRVSFISIYIDNYRQEYYDLGDNDADDMHAYILTSKEDGGKWLRIDLDYEKSENKSLYYKFSKFGVYFEENPPAFMDDNVVSLYKK